MIIYNLLAEAQGELSVCGFLEQFSDLALFTHG